MANTWNIGIDIGGTNSKVGIVNDAGTILDQVTFSTVDAEDARWFAGVLFEHTQNLLRKNDLTLNDIAFIGMGVPGTVEPRTGFVTFCPNIPWVDVPLGVLMEQTFDRRVEINQDVRLAAVAEMHCGAGQGFTDILCVVVGTGIGAGIIVEGELYTGALNTAGEMGHMIMEKGGRPCACGQSGCLERYASGSGIAAHAREVLAGDVFGDRPQTTETVFKLAKEGNQEAMQIVDEGVEYLARGIANAVNLLSPQIVIVGGGVAQNGDIFFTPLREYVYRYGFYSWAKEKKVEIRKTGLGTDAVMIGAAVGA